MSEILEKLKSRGYWRILVRPAEFVATRVQSLLGLGEIVRKSALELRGWDFPHITLHTNLDIGLDWVGQEVDWSEHVESWRLYQSGQFAFYGSILDDWQDQSIWESLKPDWRAGQYLSVFDTIARFTAAYEFASRISLTEAGGEMISIHVTIVGLRGRELRIDHPRRSGFSYPRTAAIPEFPFKVSVPRAQLVAEARELALVNANELFTRFNWTPGVEFLRGMQNEF